MNEMDERQLIVLARDDPAAFAVLYERYIRRIYGYVFRQVSGDAGLAQDITAVTFEQALRHLRRYQWRGVSFGAWLYSIARNEIAQHFRRKTITRLFDTIVSPHSVDLEQSVQIQQEHSALHTALAQLSKGDRELLSLRYFEDLSHTEIAQVLGCSVQNVYVRLHRALNRLRQQLDVLQREENVYVSE